MRRAAIGILTIALLAAASATQALAEKRLALVVGNDAYENVPKLHKAVNDARVLTATLEEVGFQVIPAENVTRRKLNRKLLEFSAQLNTGDVAMFFFAGHGVEIEGRNYLLPTDIPSAVPGQEDFVKAEAVAVDQVLDSMRKKGARVSILVLDACRDNPFPREGTRSVGGTRGFARVAPARGAFVIYSAGTGQTALDRLGDNDPHPNSVFTRSLIPLLKKPGLSLTETARQVRRDVLNLAATVAHDQRPAYYDEITGDFFFSGRARETKRPDVKGPREILPGEAAQAWSIIEDTTSPAVLKAFIARFKDTFYAELAAARMKELEAEGGDNVANLTPIPPAEPKVKTPAPRHACDTFAAATYDPEAMARGLRLRDIDPSAALAACRSALETYPETTRFMFQLGRSLERANQVAEARELYRRAADNGHAAAMSSLGALYETGRGVRQDALEARRWYGKAADKDIAVALNNLAALHQHGIGGASDYREARRLYLRAVKAGAPRALYNLGFLHDKGLGVSPDAAEAADWYRKAVREGDALAMLTLGLMHLQGRGVRQDDSEAARLFEHAANRDSGAGKTNLAMLYDAGRGVGRDGGRAGELLLEAFLANDQAARRNLFENADAWSDEARRQVQKSLRLLGHYRGGIDGQLGPGSQRALELALRAKSGR